MMFGCYVETFTTLPGFNVGNIRRTFGINGLVSARRFDGARRATMASLIFERFCWLAMEPSIVTSTSKPSCAARARSFPFFNPAQPILGTDLTSWPGRNCSSRQFRFSSSRIFTSGVGEDFLFHFLEHGQHLRALHAGESIEKNLDRIAGFEMVEQALYRHARTFEDQCAAENLRVRMIGAFFAHGQTIRPFKSSGKIALVSQKPSCLLKDNRHCLVAFGFEGCRNENLKLQRLTWHILCGDLQTDMLRPQMMELLGHDVFGEFGLVALAAQVRKVKLPQVGGDDLGDGFGRGDVGDVAVAAEDALFQRP